MLTKDRVFLCVALLGLTSHMLPGAESVRCDVNAGVERKATIPNSCKEGVITFEFPWVEDKKPLLISTKGRKDDFTLCLYSCSEKVHLNGKKRLLGKGKTLCVNTKRITRLYRINTGHKYEISFRYFNKANLSAFKKNPDKSC